MSAQVSVVAGTAPVSPLQNPSWNYTVATRTGNACDETLSASVIAGVPLFTVGNLGNKIIDNWSFDILLVGPGGVSVPLKTQVQGPPRVSPGALSRL